MTVQQQLLELEQGQWVSLTYRCRDIGYGVEEDCGEYVYRGIDYGKYSFRAHGTTIYLFEDEVEELERIDAPEGETGPRLYAAIVEVDRGLEDGYERVATWEHFGMDEAEALTSIIRAARREWPVEHLRVRPAMICEAVTSRG
jgi:hypothetical protein